MNVFDQERYRYIQVLNKLFKDKMTHDNINSEETCQDWAKWIEQKKMTQWSLRITAYSERLLEGLNKVDFSESLKEQQKNWIGKSIGATITFKIKNKNEKIVVFTTRPDTIFGVSFMTLAPENEMVEKITSSEKQQEVKEYVNETLKKSERERQIEKKITGVFTGAYATHPFNLQKIDGNKAEKTTLQYEIFKN